MNYLPPDVIALIDIDSMALSKDTFVDEEFSEYFSDIVYSAHLKQGDDVCVYFLFEHKSYREPLVLFLLLRYMVKIWTVAVKNKKPLMPIIPIVVYHGKEGWTLGENFQSLIPWMPEQLRVYVPDFKSLIYDLNVYNDKEIKGAVMLKTALLLLKYIFDDTLRHKLPGILKLLEELQDKGSGIEYLVTILRYLASGAEHLSQKDLKDAVSQSFSQEGGEIMGTIAQQWFNEGRIKGEIEGKIKGEIEGEVKAFQKVIIEILEIRFQAVPSSLIDKVKATSELQILEGLRKKALTVNSVAQFEAMVQ